MRRAQDCLRVVALLVITATVFSSLTASDFVYYDDPVVVSENPYLRAGLSHEGIRWAFSTTYYGNWMPLTWLSHLADYQFFGLDPRWHHLTSLLFHAANTTLLYLTLQAMTGGVWKSFVVAALFAVHPLHVESVAWVTMRRDMVSTFFWIMAMWAYHRYARAPSLGRYLLVTLAFLCGQMGKAMLVTFPFVLLLLDYWPLNRLAPEDERGGLPPGGRPTAFALLLKEKLPLFILAAAFSVVAYRAQSGLGAVVTAEVLPLWNRIANALYSYGWYAWKMLWPRDLTVFYLQPASVRPFAELLAPALLLLGVSAIVIALGRRYRYLVAGWGWYLGTLLPVSGLVQLGESATPDRYTYVPYIGLFIMAVWGTADIVRRLRWRRAVETALTIAVLGVLMVLAKQQASYWRNSDALFRHAIEVEPDNYVAHINLGNLRAMEGNEGEAIEHYRRALQTRPNEVFALVNLGISYLNERRYEDARLVLEKASRISPSQSEAQYNLGKAYQGLGLQREAAGAFQRAAAAKRLSR